MPKRLVLSCPGWATSAGTVGFAGDLRAGGDGVAAQRADRQPEPGQGERLDDVAHGAGGCESIAGGGEEPDDGRPAQQLPCRLQRGPVDIRRQGAVLVIGQGETSEDEGGRLARQHSSW